MKYSVVIPLYNKRSCILQTLESVLRQDFEDYEIIVVDDGSTDGSLQLVQSLKNSRLRLLPQENAGVACARNTGIQAARGDYIAFLDADDLWHADYLSTIDRLTERFPESDIFVTAYRVLLGANCVRNSTILPVEEGCLDSYWCTLENSYDFVWTSATVIRRRTLLEAGLFLPGEMVGQDLDMWARVARINPRVAYSSKQCVDYIRYAEHNARTRVRIAYAGAFLRDLEEELENPARTAAELQAIQNKYDRKMTVYIYTCLLAGERERAKTALHAWQGRSTRRNRLLRSGLRGAMLSPHALLRFVYGIRLRVF